VLARQGEQPTGGSGTPKPVARCVPGRAQRSKPGRADIVTPSAVAQPRHEHWRDACGAISITSAKPHSLAPSAGSVPVRRIGG